MYIQELIIEGFKSYATRTVISGFDPQFNAITGLNGSGKSNILDAICFVLGISNLSQVRVGNLQELVYKQGQAGVTKASVTIIFDNSDSLNSPVGYEQHKQITVTRQIIIGGKNKYLINGHTVQQQQLQNFFHSVQLNVNNPHFLIMQGRITKVLNMKPIEILSMIEETAGTRMYEIKKQSALKTIEKKQLKVNELSEILNHDITPRLEQLRCDKLNYQEWSNGHHEIERLEKLCVVYEYQEAEMKVLNTENYQNEMKLEILNFTNEQKELMKRNELLENDIKQIEMKREQEQEGEYQELKKREQEMSKELVKINTNYQNMKLNLLKEKEVNDGNLQQIAQTEEILLLKKHEFQQQEGFVLEAQRGIEKMQQEIEVQQLKYQNACAGVVTTTTTVGTDGGGGSILSDVETMSTLTVTEQIGLWETKLRESQSQQQQGKMKQKYQQKKLKELVEIRKPQEERKHLEEMEKLNELREEIQILEKKIKKMNPTASSSSSSSSSLSPSEREERLQEQHVALRSQMESLSDQIETMTTQIQTRLNFEFRDPERGFDRNRVKGLVASLIHVKESAQHATALEIAAGNKLYQVVVDNEQTGKLLLGKGILKKRVTILPLNKISNRVLDDNKLSLASSIARGKHGTAELALELIGYDEEVTRAMQHVFGNAIICSSNQIAEAIAFDPKIRCRTITFDGDTFDPSGTVTGGSRNQIGALLMKMSELNDLRGRYEELSQENQKIERELDNLNQLSQQFSETNQTLQRKLQERQILEERISSGAYSQLCQEIEGLEREIQQFDQEILPSLSHSEDLARQELNKLKDTSTASNLKSQRAETLKAMESHLKSLQKSLTLKKNELISLQSACNAFHIEIQSLTQEIQLLHDTRENSEKILEKELKEEKKFEVQLQKKRSEYEQLQHEMSELTNQFSEYAAEMKKKREEKENNSKEIQKLSLECRKINHKLDCWKKDIAMAQHRVEDFLERYPWIAEMKQYFHDERSEYNFHQQIADSYQQSSAGSAGSGAGSGARSGSGSGGFNIEECREKLLELKKSQEKLNKKVNKKVMGMIDKAESESEDLLRKREVILKDKEKIEAVINELDVKKIQAIQNTWVRVNKDFGSIFSTLLPGTLAKLDLLEGSTVMDGLEVKVSFNGVWKESLTELSGGQRSLLALSLILALLLFKPAPMYILDEVDAALDLSHTQNIGLMLRTHFSTSQFIVVSLKEGMFNNANVIFRTRFIDGISTVMRTVAGSKSNTRHLVTAHANAANGAAPDDEEEESRSPLKKKGKSNSRTKKRMEGVENAMVGL